MIWQATFCNLVHSFIKMVYLVVGSGGSRFLDGKLIHDATTIPQSSVWVSRSTHTRCSFKGANRVFLGDDLSMCKYVSCVRLNVYSEICSSPNMGCWKMDAREKQNQRIPTWQIWCFACVSNEICFRFGQSNAKAHQCFALGAIGLGLCTWVFFYFPRHRPSLKALTGNAESDEDECLDALCTLPLMPHESLFVAFSYGNATRNDIWNSN